jgi:hypothetical protein
VSLSTYIDEPLAICHLIGGANGLPWDKELSDDQIKAHVAKCIRVWREIERQLSKLNDDRILSRGEFEP